MPTQSIDLETVTEANFNGTAVEQINLNGTGIWTMPIAGSALYAPFSPTYNASACQSAGSNYYLLADGIPHSTSNQDATPGNTPTPSGCSLAVMNINGVAYIGAFITGTHSSNQFTQYTDGVQGNPTVKASLDSIVPASVRLEQMLTGTPKFYTWFFQNGCFAYTNAHIGSYDYISFYPIASISATDGFVLLDASMSDVWNQSFSYSCVTTQYGTTCGYYKAEYTRTQWTFTGKFGNDSGWNIANPTYTIDPVAKTITDSASSVAWRLEP
jgi:hypothetical protein